MGLLKSKAPRDAYGHEIEAETVYVCAESFVLMGGPTGDLYGHQGARRFGSDPLVQAWPAAWFKDGSPQPIPRWILEAVGNGS
jgi:hypothetical protein